MASAALAFAVHLHLSVLQDREVEKARYVEHEIAKLERDVMELRDLEPTVRLLLARKPVVEALQQDRQRAARLLDRVARLRGEGIRLDSLILESGSVRLAGSAASADEVRAFAAKLAMSPQVSAARRAGPVGFRIAGTLE